MNSFGIILKQHRTAKGLSQQDVADRLNVTKATYYNWETGKYDIKVSYMPKLAEVFGVDIPALFPPDLTVTINRPNGREFTIEAQKLYDKLAGFQEEKIRRLEEQVQMLEAEIQRPRKL
jgi:transcriptional regulator with XRE-family HTH domain